MKTLMLAHTGMFPHVGGPWEILILTILVLFLLLVMTSGSKNTK